MDNEFSLLDDYGYQDLQYIKEGDSLLKFKATADDQPILLRVFDDPVRAKIEADVLIKLKGVTGVFDKYKIIFPAINNIIRLPNHTVIELEWIDGQPMNRMDPDSLFCRDLMLELTELLSNVRVDIPLFTQLYLDSILSIEGRFAELFNPILSGIDFSDIFEDTQLIHGDLHLGNMILNRDQNTIGIIDWEFASIGARIYELAYFSLNERIDFLEDEILMTKGKLLASAAIVSWEIKKRPTNKSAIERWLGAMQKLKDDLLS